MLDDSDRVRAIDSRGMLGAIRSLPKHFAEGLKRGQIVADAGGPVSDILVCGLGGSAIGGDMIRAWLETEGARCEVVRGYEAPSWVDKNTLALLASYSGNTEETLSALDDVSRKGASMIGITSGGTMAKTCRKQSIPVIEVPGGLVPRASFGYMFGAMMGVIAKAGIANPREQVDEAMLTLDQVNSMCDIPVSTVDNPAKKLAHELHGLVPVVIGHGLSVPVAKRWANQFNENAKSIAFSSQLPEMDHNEIVFWSLDPRSQGFSGIFLDHDFSDARMKRRLEATQEMMRERSRVHLARASGRYPLAQMLSLVLTGDYVSFYSAILRGQDPSTTEPIELLKAAILKK